MSVDTQTSFVGYDGEHGVGRIVAMFSGTDAVTELNAGAEGQVVLDITPALAGGESLYDLVAGALTPTDDIHATGAYRRHLAATLTARSVPQALSRARATAEVSA